MGSVLVRLFKGAGVRDRRNVETARGGRGGGQARRSVLAFAGLRRGARGSIRNIRYTYRGRVRARPHVCASCALPGIHALRKDGPVWPVDDRPVARGQRLERRAAGLHMSGRWMEEEEEEEEQQQQSPACGALRRSPALSFRAAPSPPSLLGSAQAAQTFCAARGVTIGAALRSLPCVTIGAALRSLPCARYRGGAAARTGAAGRLRSLLGLRPPHQLLWATAVKLSV